MWDGEVNFGRAGGAVVVYCINFHLIFSVVLEIMELDSAGVSRNFIFSPFLILLVLFEMIRSFYCIKKCEMAHFTLIMLVLHIFN